jgi:hypothetical protein
MSQNISSVSIIFEDKKIKIKSENLAYWYFRLNGFLTIQNFVVHPNSGSAQRTECDIISARFPYRKELPENKNPMQDDERLILKPDKIRIILAEVKAGKCKINPAWINTNKNNMQQIFSAIGAFDQETLVSVSNELYQHGYYEDINFVVSLCCIGKQVNEKYFDRFLNVPQLTWESIISFIYDRFYKYEKYKNQHQQWDQTGQNLYKHYEHFQKSYDREEFLATIEIT